MLFDYLMDFWEFWLGANFTDVATKQLLAAVSSIALVYGLLILPLLRIFRGRKK